MSSEFVGSIIQQLSSFEAYVRKLERKLDAVSIDFLLNSDHKLTHVIFEQTECSNQAKSRRIQE
jgi:hypothetical protein